MRLTIRRKRWHTETVEVRIKPRRPIRWPLVRRTKHDSVAFLLWQADEKIKKQETALANLGHARDNGIRDAARVLADLRVIRLHIDRSPYKSFGDGPIRFQFELADSLLLDAFRRDATLHSILAYHIEYAFMSSPEGYRSLFTERTVTP